MDIGFVLMLKKLREGKSKRELAMLADFKGHAKRKKITLQTGKRSVFCITLFRGRQLITTM